MQAVAERTKTKKSRAPVVLVIIVLLLAAVVAFYWFIMRPAVERGYASPAFVAMPVDTAGNNLIGNIPENSQAGGFMAGQNGWIYFANFEDNGALYMCREGGESMVKLTDFPVANINVMSDTLVFTGLEECYATDPDNGVFRVGFDSISNLLDKIQGAQRCWYGGPLYAIYGIRATGNELKLALLGTEDGSDAFFFPYLDKDGLLASSGGKLFANKFNGYGSPVGDGRIIGQYVHGDMIYTELRGTSGSSIVRVDKKSLQPIDSLRGESLYRSGNGFVFLNTDSDYGFVYQISPDGNEISPISSMPIAYMSMNQLGEITAKLTDSTDSADVLISKTLLYPDLTGRIMAYADRIVLQNGWYNYLAPSEGLKSYIQNPGIFRANDAYYQIGQDGVWTRDGEPVEWLRTKLSQSVTVKDMFLTEDSFALTGATDIVDRIPAPESITDFGNEVSGGNEDSNVFADPKNALDAAVMLMRGDDSVYDKYPVADVDALKIHYGDSFDKLVDASAQGFSSTIGSRLGASPDTQTMSGIVASWLKIAKYSIGNANTDADTSLVALTTSNVADSSLLYSSVESEIMNQATKNPMLLFKSKDQQAAWALDALLAILKNPEQYNILSSESVENSVTMINHPDIGWVVKDISELIRCFARGM